MPRPRNVIVPLLCAMLVCAWPGILGAADFGRTIVLASDLEAGPELDKVQDFYKAVFAKLGLGAQLVPLPAARGFVTAAQGRVDGDSFRIQSLEDGVDSLVRVPQPIAETGLGIYARRDDLGDAATLESLLAFAGAALDIGYTRGSVRIEELLAQRGDTAPHRTIALAEKIQGLRLLARERLDVFLLDDVSARLLLGREEFRDAGIRRLGEIGRIQGYLYLNRRLEALVPEVARALREALGEGLLTRYVGDLFH